MDQENFKNLFIDLQKNGFWCYQGDTDDEAYNYIKNLDPIRFAKTNEIFPNMELIPFDDSKKAKSFEFKNPQKIRIKDFDFKISPLEFEILYKEIILAGKKDLEDAKHLRIFFSEILKEEKFKEYKKIITDELK